ncbi:hypothetical protein M5689_020615 [Euphorbia peplus]|nr:hypothetical protein M5689_020615 [Euphorbia peplus]
MRPSSTPIGFQEGSKDETFQSWNKYGECPKGTIPIVKSELFYIKKTSGPFLNRTHPMESFTSPHEVHPSLTGVKKPRLFTFWTKDSYGNTGCYNLQCPGFVQISTKVALGADLSPLSTYNSKQFQMQLTIHKDKSSGNWWLTLGKEEIGYWPSSIFTSLAESSRLIEWGGEIINARQNGKHTSTQMGSGHFSTEGFRKAAYVANLGYIDNSGAMITPDPNKLLQVVTSPACYDFKFGPRGTQLGLHFYYGGPGFSPRCL